LDADEGGWKGIRTFVETLDCTGRRRSSVTA
jgi:hypothetical protein